MSLHLGNELMSRNLLVQLHVLVVLQAEKCLPSYEYKDYHFLSFSISGVPSVSTPGGKRKNESRKEATQTREREEKEEMRPTILVTARGNFVMTRKSSVLVHDCFLRQNRSHHSNLFCFQQWYFSSSLSLKIHLLFFLQVGTVYFTGNTCALVTIAICY